MNIHLHIERLILDGLPAGASPASHLREAIEAELARLLAAGDVNDGLLAGGALHSLRGGEIQLDIESSPTELGHQIAGAIQTGLRDFNQPRRETS